jgi:hypothetical protein
MKQYISRSIRYFISIPHTHISRMIEAITDPKTWLFALFAVLRGVPGSLINQQSLIIASFGFTTLQTTLLSCVPGAIDILTIFTAVRLAARRPNSRAYVAAAYFVPPWLGVLLVSLLPWSNQVCNIAPTSEPSCPEYHNIRLDFLLAFTYVSLVLVPCLYAHRSVANAYIPGFVLGLSWLNSITAGHTKKVGTSD